MLESLTKSFKEQAAAYWKKLREREYSRGMHHMSAMYNLAHPSLTDVIVPQTLKKWDKWKLARPQLLSRFLETTDCVVFFVKTLSYLCIIFAFIVTCLLFFWDTLVVMGTLSILLDS